VRGGLVRVAVRSSGPRVAAVEAKALRAARKSEMAPNPCMLVVREWR